MSELCYKEAYIKLVKGLLIGTMSVLIFQALTIRRLGKNLDTGRQRFNQLHDASEYILNVINENGIELTEFDVIALTEMLEGQTSG